MPLYLVSKDEKAVAVANSFIESWAWEGTGFNPCSKKFYEEVKAREGVIALNLSEQKIEDQSVNAK